MKKIRGDKPTAVIAHTCYLHLKPKYHVFLFYLFPFFSFREQEGRPSPAWGVGSHPWKGRGVG
jgi:hypothetical protein